MKHQKRTLTLGALLVLGGCSQIIGLSDYKTDPRLDGSAGEAASQGGETGEGGSGPGSQGGSHVGGKATNAAGEANGQAGSQTQAGQGGEAQTQGGTAPTGAGGAGGAGGDGSPGGAGNEGGAPYVPLCTTSKCCKDMSGVAVPTELLKNGNFENNPVTWGTSSSTQGTIFTEESVDTISAHSGTWFAWLGGAVNDVSVLLSPEFKVPWNTGWLVVSGYYWLKFDTAGDLGDAAYVEMYDATGDFSNPEETFYSWTTSASDTSGWKLFGREIPVKDYAGRTHHISATSTTDDLQDDPLGQLASNFFFDDFSVKAYSCSK